MVSIMVVHATFNNISLISETGVPGENYRPVARYWQTLSPNFVSSTPRYEWDRTHN